MSSSPLSLFPVSLLLLVTLFYSHLISGIEVSITRSLTVFTHTCFYPQDLSHNSNSCHRLPQAAQQTDYTSLSLWAGDWQRGLETSFFVAPVKKFGQTRLNTDFVGKTRGELPREAFVKSGKRFACFRFKHLRKSSNCPTSKFWTFWGSGGKCCSVNLRVGTPLWSNVDVYFSVRQIVVITA